jgi:hypothetical protein
MPRKSGGIALRSFNGFHALAGIGFNSLAGSISRRPDRLIGLRQRALIR